MREGHSPALCECPVRCRKDGSLVAVEVNASPMFDLARRVSAVSVIFRDLTERRQAELEGPHQRGQAKTRCRRRRDRARNHRLGTTPVGMRRDFWHAKSVNVGDHADNALLHILTVVDACPAAFHLTVKCTSLPGLARSAHRRSFDLAGNGFIAIEHRIVRLDGSVCWVAARKQVEFTACRSDQSRRATTGSLALRDISERKQAASILSRSEASYRSALAAGRLVTWETDRVAKTRTWSKESMQLLGLTNADGRGQSGG